MAKGKFGEMGILSQRERMRLKKNSIGKVERKGKEGGVSICNYKEKRRTVKGIRRHLRVLDTWRRKRKRGKGEALKRGKGGKKGKSVTKKENVV